ncbi:MAG: hypothetical protein EP330_22155 [Deltaproteobacteria bacterium]|nr:MAG: hypothetical protein EP330_22155 [Deltaproteobacteria bacterium]
MRLLAPMLFTLTACQGGLRCPSLSDDAEELPFQLASLGYGQFDGEDPFVIGAGEVLQTQDAWDSAVTRWGTDGGLSPDFATELVFVNRWDTDGCGGRTVDYAPWLDADRLRMVLRVNEPSSTCDMALSQIDLLVVAHGGATDIAWCAPE